MLSGETGVTPNHLDVEEPLIKASTPPQPRKSRLPLLQAVFSVNSNDKCEGSEGEEEEDNKEMENFVTKALTTRQMSSGGRERINSVATV